MLKKKALQLRIENQLLVFLIRLLIPVQILFSIHGIIGPRIALLKGVTYKNEEDQRNATSKWPQQWHDPGQESI